MIFKALADKTFLKEGKNDDSSDLTNDGIDTGDIRVDILVGIMKMNNYKNFPIPEFLYSKLSPKKKKIFLMR